MSIEDFNRMIEQSQPSSEYIIILESNEIKAKKIINALESKMSKKEKPELLKRLRPAASLAAIGLLIVNVFKAIYVTMKRVIVGTYYWIKSKVSKDK